MAGDRAWVKGEGFKIDVDMSEIKNTLTDIRSYDTRTQASIERAIDTGTKNTKSKAQSKAPEGKTRKLKKSIKAHFDEKKATGTIYTKRPTAHLMEYGVSASTARVKRYRGMNIPGIGYRKFANIPARAAQPFMKPAADEEMSALIAAIRKAVEKP